MTNLEQILQRKSNVENGILNHIPYNLDTLCNYYPVFTKGLYSAITANPSAGKSTMWKYMVFTAIENCIEHNIKAKFLLYLLEENEYQFNCSLLLYILNKKYGRRMGFLELNSYTQKRLSNEDVKLITQAYKDCEKYYEYLIIEEDVSNPTGIFLKSMEYLQNNGLICKTRKYLGKELGEKEVWEQTDKGREWFTVIIVDHVSLLATEREAPTLRDSIIKWSDYSHKTLTKKLGCTVINVHQQQAAAENVEHLKANRIIPTQDKLADAPVIGRDYRGILGVFFPARYELEQHNGYDIRFLNNYYRSLHVIKNTFGSANLLKSIYFDGACIDVFELPDSKNMNAIQAVYKKIREL